GDRREDKARLAALVELIPGLRAVDCGPLELARIVEQLTPLIISINVRNKVRAGIRITGLDAWPDRWSCWPGDRAEPSWRAECSMSPGLTISWWSRTPVTTSRSTAATSRR